MSEEPEVGSRAWFEDKYRKRGPVDAILRLLEQEAISRAKALELIVFATSSELFSPGFVPEAPWEELDWGGGGPLLPRP